MSQSAGTSSVSVTDLETQFRLTTVAVRSLVVPLAEEQLLWRPTPQAWSVAECLDHLTKTATEYLPRLEGALRRSTPIEEGRRIRMRHGFIVRRFIARMEPSARARYRSPRAFAPAANLDSESVIRDFEVSRRRYETLFELAARRRWHRVRATHPIIPGVRLKVGDWLGILAAHDRRHLSQACRVTEHPSFPAVEDARRRPIVL